MKRWRPRLSIRYKMLLVILAVLSLAMGTFLYLATSLFTADKLAYIYDLNSSLVQTQSEQTRSNLNVLIDKISMFAREVLQPGLPEEVRSTAAAEFFTRERDILRVEVFSPGGSGGPHQLEYAFINRGLLEENGLSQADLELMRKERLLPLEAVAAQGGQAYLQNSSLPPDAAILTLATPYTNRSRQLVVAADFLHERILRIFGRSRLYVTYLVDDRGEVLAHPDASKVIFHWDISRHPLVREALKAKVDRGALEFSAEDGSSMLGAYAKVGIARLSVLTQIPKAEALRASRELIQRSILFGLAILIVAFLASVFFSRILSAPIRRLRAASEFIGKGHFDVKVGVKSRDEIGDLARAFEHMASTLKETQAQLVRSEKMAAFGQLGAGITHEVKNPISGILGFAQLGQLQINDKEKVLEALQVIVSEAKRCSEILTNFLKFARRGTEKYGILDLNEVIQDTAKICSHQLMINKVRIELELGEDVPPVWGNASELQQALLNLALNAQQAMPGGGRVRISSGRDGQGSAVMSVSDNGPGIPEEIRSKIFEPFFSTKPPGEGTGLGLSIVFGIIRDHKGLISLDSEIGRGTTFTISLPAHTGEE